MDRLFDIVIYVIFAAIILWKIQIKPTVDKAEMCNRLNALRGVFALEIIVGHVARYEQSLLYPLGKLMIISVAFFFFVSAFSMVMSYQKKGVQYFTGFLKKKVGYLVGISIVIFAINALIDFCVPYYLGYVPESFNPIVQLFGTTNWYIRELIVFYIVFYLVYRYLPKYRVLAISIFTLIMMNVFFAGGLIQGWYSSSLAFPLGLLYAEYYEKCNQIMRAWYGKVIVCLLCILGLCSLLLPENSLLGMVYLRNSMCIAAMMLLVYFCKYCSCGNVITRFLGKYSTELYLGQFIFLNFTGWCGWGYKINMIFVLLTTTVLALLLHPLTTKMKEMLNK